MTNTLTPRAYRSSIGKSIGCGLFALPLLAVFCTFVYFLAQMKPQPMDLFWDNTVFGCLLALTIALFCINIAAPDRLQLDPIGQSYRYSTGAIWPLANRESGPYSNLKCIAIEPNYGSGPTDITFAITLMWISSENTFQFGIRKEIGAAREFAQATADETGVSYGGIYDHARWTEGPNSELADQDAHASRNATTPSASNGGGQTSAPRATANPALPPAIGDDAGLNSSDMWK